MLSILKTAVWEPLEPSRVSCRCLIGASPRSGAGRALLGDHPLNASPRSSPPPGIRPERTHHRLPQQLELGLRCPNAAPEGAHPRPLLRSLAAPAFVIAISACHGTRWGSPPRTLRRSAAGWFGGRLPLTPRRCSTTMPAVRVEHGSRVIDVRLARGLAGPTGPRGRSPELAG